MPHLVHPKIITPRGIIEGTHYVPSGGFALKAIDSVGVCLEFTIVRTRSEYVEAMQTLGRFLNAHDPQLPAFDFELAIEEAFSARAPASSSALHLIP